MELPEPYDRIRREAIEEALEGDATSNAGRLIDAVRDAVERCYALHTKPVRELTDADCMEIWEQVWQGKFDSQVCQSSIEVVRNLAVLIAAKR